MPVTREEIVRAYPTLFHISLASDVAQILKHGLLSTSALLDICEVTGVERFNVESRRRPKAIQVSHSIHGSFLINDQAPMSEIALKKCLIDLSPQEWCESLNRRIFFWPTRGRLEKHLAARLGQGRKRVVFSVDTRAFVDRFGDLMELSPINSGNTMRNAARRGSKTFLPLNEYPFHERRMKVGLANAVAEITYPYAIAPDKLSGLPQDSWSVPSVPVE
jgi:hypothetical protein